MKKLLLVFGFLVGFSGAGIADQLTAPSLWKNQRGSELRLTAVGTNGSLRGTFTNYASGFQCQGIPYPIAGITTPGADDVYCQLRQMQDGDDMERLRIRFWHAD